MFGQSFQIVDNLNVPLGDIQDEPPTTTEMMVNATEGKPFKFLEEARGGRGYIGTLDTWLVSKLANCWQDFTNFWRASLA